MFDNLRQDTRRLQAIKKKRFFLYVLESLLFENGYQAVVLYRMAHWFRSHRIPVLGPLLARVSLVLTGVDLAPGAVIGPGLFVSHGSGLVVGAHVRIGAQATLLHQVTIGAPTGPRILEMPTIGDNAFIATGSRLIGDITIGDDVFIGINCIVTRDIPSGSKVSLDSDIRIE